MFVFYDLETTGTDVTFDQILQFGAIFTDNNLVEIDRFEIRCRLLPWVVPAPEALVITGTPVHQLQDPALLSFFDMMRAINDRLRSWAPAIFVGYNSMRFDEAFLQRAFWQTLLPAYLTVTKGNARLDLLPLLHAAAYFRSTIIHTPLREDGTASFRLEALARANGFNRHNAHSAIGDAEATLFLAQIIAKHIPELWRPLATRAFKAATGSILAFGSPIFLFHQSGGVSSFACCQRVDVTANKGPHAVLARLSYDWQASKGSISDIGSTEREGMRRELHRVALNKAPLVFTLTEAEALAGQVPTVAELAQSHFLANDEEFCIHLSELNALPTRVEAIQDKEVEETIFDGFPSFHDERLMDEFLRADLPEQAIIARDFADTRFRRLATRILYLSAQHLLTSREQEQMRLGIMRRLTAVRGDFHPWRSIPDALAELAFNSQQSLTPVYAEIAAWLQQRLQNARIDAAQTFAPPRKR